MSDGRGSAQSTELAVPERQAPLAFRTFGPAAFQADGWVSAQNVHQKHATNLTSIRKIDNTFQAHHSQTLQIGKVGRNGLNLGWSLALFSSTTVLNHLPN